MIDPLYAVYDRLRTRPDGTSRQVWHEAEVDGYHLYLADTSFGDGPIFSAQGHGRYASFQCPMGAFIPLDTQTSVGDLEWITPLLARAEWVDKLHESERRMGYRP